MITGFRSSSNLYCFPVSLHIPIPNFALIDLDNQAGGRDIGRAPSSDVELYPYTARAIDIAKMDDGAGADSIENRPSHPSLRGRSSHDPQRSFG